MRCQQGVLAAAAPHDLNGPVGNVAAGAMQRNKSELTPADVMEPPGRRLNISHNG
jgi:hypothetical protein